jgi:hypothetical protein
MLPVEHVGAMEAEAGHFLAGDLEMPGSHKQSCSCRLMGGKDVKVHAWGGDDSGKCLRECHGGL